mmetsp:Transcript_37839/g.43480  ORF Transcript_37839/g.43480 Transcript_37839/m.43480 type:complete len:121 (-) Transcript_37839:327-689(-)
MFLEDLKKFVEYMNSNNEPLSKKADDAKGSVSIQTKQSAFSTVHNLDDHLKETTIDENSSNVSLSKDIANKLNKKMETFEKSLKYNLEEEPSIYSDLKDFLPSSLGEDKLDNFYSVSQMI